MSAAVQVPVSMSMDEFIDWEPGDGQQWQLVDGVPQAMAPASDTHGTLQAELAYLLTAHFRQRKIPCRAVANPGVVPRVQSSRNVRIPDLGVTCKPSEKDVRMLVEPVVLIEILSPSNQSETWASVWAYTTLPSVQEIVVLRTAVVGADLLRRQADGTWPEEPERIASGDFVLESIEFRVPLVDVYAATWLASP